MRPFRSLLWLVSLLVGWLLCGTRLPAAEPLARLVQTPIASPLHLIGGTSLRRGATVKGQLLTQVRTNRAGELRDAQGQTIAAAQFARVRTLHPAEEGWAWVSVAHIMPVADLPPAARQTMADIAELQAGSWDDVPSLIRLQPRPVREAWRSVAEALATNETLSQPLPEPFFARAELWSLVQNHEDAIRDYLAAVRLVLETDGYSPDDHSAYLRRLAEVLRFKAESPQPAVLGRGREHYMAGVHAFYRGDSVTALRHLDNAVQVEPEVALHWYYRALTHHQRGATEAAHHDALIGAHVEWAGGRKQKLGWALVRVQGTSRMWLERYRLGDPSQQLARSSGGRTLAHY